MDGLHWTRARITTLLLPTPQQAHQTNSTASPAPSHTHNHFVHRTRAIIITLPCPLFASRPPPTPSSPLHTSIPSQPARPLQPAVAPSHALSSTHHRRDRNSFLDPIQVSTPLRPHCRRTEHLQHTNTHIPISISPYTYPPRARRDRHVPTPNSPSNSYRPLRHERRSPTPPPPPTTTKL